MNDAPEAGAAAPSSLLKSALYCSFCGKSQHVVRKLIAGPAVFICDECVALCTAIIAKENEPPEAPEAPPPKIEWPKDMPTENLLGFLKNQNATLEQVRERLQASIDILREREVSWEKIGTALGVSRQAAWERFG